MIPLSSAGRIVRASHRHISAPLRSPYVLSFATIRSFDVRLVDIVLDDGRSGTGEAVALHGYGDESDADLARILDAIVPKLEGLDTDAATEVMASSVSPGSFARSAIGHAIEMASWEQGGDKSEPPEISWPQVAAIGTSKPSLMISEIERLADTGFETIKVKIGRDVTADCAGAVAILRDGPSSVRFRFDANQGYTEDAARRFLDVVGAESAQRRSRIELLEQPLGIDAWDSFARLTPHASIPLMLDESIYGPADVTRAADVGAKLVKLKGYKFDSIRALLDCASSARDLGLDVVLGNGVAADIGNQAEALAWHASDGAFFGAGEANGFAKMVAPVTAHPPRMHRGNLRTRAWRSTPRGPSVSPAQ